MIGEIERSKHEAERIAVGLRTRFPNQSIVVTEEGFPAVWLYGSREYAQDARAAAEQEVERGELDITVEVRTAVQCSESPPVELAKTRALNEPAHQAPEPMLWHDRGVLLYCVNDKPHEHDWGDYRPLNPRRYGY